MLPMLMQAGKIALPNVLTKKLDKRGFWLGCIGIRHDGVKVKSRNIANHSSDSEFYECNPHAHAEGRALKKMGKGGILYVSRISKKTGELAMARPCEYCQRLIRAHKVEKVYYSINATQYGILEVSTMTDRVFEKP